MLVNFNTMLQKAKKEKYAIAHFNINNLEWTKYILEKCNELKTPVILGVSESAVKYMGGFKVVTNMVKGLIEDLNIKSPVCLHLDHGKSVETCIKAIDAGFTSVMIDASDKKLEENIKITKKVVDYAHKYNVSVEAEIGYIGIETNDKMNNATLDDCIKLYENTNVDAIAPALGSVHGFYKGKPNLDYDTMKKISQSIKIPLVLHGGTGIPNEDIIKSIQFGISKININTELQSIWSKEVRQFLINDKQVYDPRKIISIGECAIKNKIEEIIILFQKEKCNNNKKELI